MAVSNISSYQLGKLVQIDFNSKIKYQLSKRVKDFDNFVTSFATGDEGGARSFEFPLQTSGGPNATQSAATDGTITEFPDAQLSDVGFYEGVYKAIDTTIQLSLDMWNKAKKAPELRYLEPLMLESQSKALTARKEMCINLYGDGTGARGVVSSIAYASSAVTITLDSSAMGHAGWLQHGELILVLPNTATIGASVRGTISANRAVGTGGTALYMKVTGRNLRNNTVTCGTAYTSAGVEIAITGIGDIVATDVIYKRGTGVAVATDSTPSGDYNTLTEVGAGYESILASDGRVVHGITMSGAVAGTSYTASGAFDPQHIQEGVTDVKTITGDEYDYNQLVMAPKLVDVFVEGLNTDQYVRADDPKKRGGKAFYYSHGNDMLELVGSEFCPNNRIYANPAGGSEDGSPLEFRGHDFEMVDMDGQSQFLSTGSSGYKKGIEKFLCGRYCFVSKHPAASLVISGFDQP